MTDEEIAKTNAIIADFDRKADYWTVEAHTLPADVAVHCLDYARRN